MRHISAPAVRSALHLLCVIAIITCVFLAGRTVFAAQQNDTVVRSVLTTACNGILSLSNGAIADTELRNLHDSFIGLCLRFSPPSTCAPLTVDWSQNGNVCSATLPKTPVGTVVTATDLTGTTGGSATYLCAASGQWLLKEATTATLPTCQQLTEYRKKANFTGTKTPTQALTLPSSLTSDTTALQRTTAPFGGTLLKTTTAGHSIKLSGHFVMNKGNTQQVFYSDTLPTSVTDGHLLRGGMPRWNRYTATQHWQPQTPVPANRYYWIRGAYDLTYSTGSWVEVGYRY